MSLSAAARPASTREALAMLTSALGYLAAADAAQMPASEQAEGLAGLAYAIPVAYKQRIETIPHVEVVLAESWFGGVYHEVSDQFPNLAVHAEQVDLMWPDYGISKEQFD